MLVLGVSAGKRAAKAVDLHEHMARIVALKKPASRAARRACMHAKRNKYRY